MKYQNINLVLKNSICIIEINRPDHLNALNRLTLNEIENAFDFIYSNNDIRGVVVTATGERAFIAGADIKEFTEFNQKQLKEMVENGQRVLKKIEQCPKPVIAAVNGFALGGGCELAMACHLRIASKNAQFGLPEVKLGIIPGYGGTQRLLQLIGKTRSMELILTGKTITSTEAFQYGLVNKIVSQKELISESIKILNDILANAPSAVTGSINAINAFFDNGKDGYVSEIEEFVNCIKKEDFKEGISAFIQKRKPKFKGR